jgi:phage baseplate assembly protein W
MHIGFPRSADNRGRTRLVDRETWIRSLIEAVLFTAPGERVNRPDFGSGLGQLVFAGNDEALAAATQVTVQGALLTWLAGVVEVRGVTVTSDEATLEVTVTYVVAGETAPTTATFRSPA